MPKQEKKALNGSNPGQLTLEALTVKRLANQDGRAVHGATAELYLAFLQSDCFSKTAPPSDPLIPVPVEWLGITMSPSLSDSGL